MPDFYAWHLTPIVQDVLFVAMVGVLFVVAAIAVRRSVRTATVPWLDIVVLVWAIIAFDLLWRFCRALAWDAFELASLVLDVATPIIIVMGSMAVSAELALPFLWQARLNRTTAALTMALIVSIGFNIALYDRVESLESIRTYYKDDVPIIRRALKEVAERHGEEPKGILERSVPMVIRSPQGVCVQFRLRMTVAGVSPVACYPPGTWE